MKRLVLPPPNRHLTSFHGVYAPKPRLRPVVLTRPAHLHLRRASAPPSAPRWPGGRRNVTALYSTRKAAEAHLADLGFPLRSLLLPQPTAPPQLQLAV